MHATYHCHFRCINPECAATYPVTDIVFRCKSCGSLLEVEHDRTQWSQTQSAEEWRQTFTDRWRSPERPYGSGVWGKHEWVLPAVDKQNVVTFYEGGSNLQPGGRLSEVYDTDLWVKMCGDTHTGSFKDLGMTVLVSMVNQMRTDGIEIPAMICASTGDTSAALAAYGAAAGIPTIVMLPRGKVSTAQLVQPLANGALVLSLDTDFDGCMALVQELTEQHQLYLANSMNSLRIEGQKTVAYDIVQQLQWEVPDWIVIPGGNLGNVSALAKGFEDMEHAGLIHKRPRICCAQAAAAAPLHQSYINNWSELQPVQAQPTLASAIRIGNPVSFAKAVRALRAFDGVVAKVEESELADISAQADRAGLYTCPHTSVALAAVQQLRQNGTIEEGQRTVVVSTAHGLKFTEFKVGYHEGTLDKIEGQHVNTPVELPPSLDAIWTSISEHIHALP